MQKKFWKMHGIGNDYIYFDCFDWQPEDPAALAVKLSDRHFSIGGDGVVLILRSDAADARMRMFNADGSEGKMCGNAIRCIGKFLYEVKGMQKPVLTVETLSGIKTLSIHAEDGIVHSVRVNMGAAELTPARIPADFAGERAVNVPLDVEGTEYRVTAVSMGNPHCVVFADPASFDLQTAALRLGESGMFPEGVNVEVAQVSGEEIRMRVFERGSGETLSCGTGACAVAAAAEAVGRVAHGAEHTMRLPGGRLQTKTTAEGILLTGEAEAVFTGAINL